VPNSDSKERNRIDVLKVRGWQIRTLALTFNRQEGKPIELAMNHRGMLT